MLRSLKKHKRQKTRIAISRKSLKSCPNKYWKSVKSIRKNEFNSTATVDDITGNINIANLFQSKFKLLYNSVQSPREKLDLLSKCFIDREKEFCCHVLEENNDH